MTSCAVASASPPYPVNAIYLYRLEVCAMTATGQPESASGGEPAIRASDQDRDAATQRLQLAFAEHRLDDEEFDQRIRAALTAKTHAELAGLTADLPARESAGQAVIPAGEPGRFAVAFKSSIRRSGRWRLGKRFTSVVYKGSGSLDLRAAELTAPVTTLAAVAYKSRVEILVPPGVRVELGGLGVSSGEPADAGWESTLPASAPLLHVKGIAYKGTIEVTTRPQAGGHSASQPELT
jgi:DUF1707 SHOCT-like domain